MICGMLAEPVGRGTAALAGAAGMLGAAATGANGAASKLLLGHLAPTSMMTGNVTQHVIDAVDRLRGVADAATRARCAMFLWPVLAFATGCAAPALAYLALGFLALAVPVAILCLLLWLPEPEVQ